MKFLSDSRLESIILFLVFSGFGFIICGIICRSSDRIVKENSEYLWIMKHQIYNLDSCICIYHKPITYDGVVTEETDHFNGVPGKGGHIVYERIITYDNNKEYKTSQFPHNCEIGQMVKVVETFYPYHKIDIIW